MRAAAEIEPIALLVYLQVLVGGNRLDELDLEGLALFSKKEIASARLQTSLVNGLSRAMIARICFSIAAKSSGVNGSSRKKS